MSHQSDPRPSFYAVIPAHVRYCKELEMGARLLYGEITALCQQEGFCWATNQYFAELYEVDNRTIKRWVESLKKEKFISIQVEKSGIQVRRLIWISPEVQKMFTKGQKCPPPGTKMSPPRDKNAPHNITENNTKNKNPPYSPPLPDPPKLESADAECVCNFFLEKLRERRPSFKEPGKEKWVKEFDYLLRIDKRPLEEVKRLIAWAAGHKWWGVACVSPSKLRKCYDEMCIQMDAPPPGPKTTSAIQESKKLSSLIKEQFDGWRCGIAGIDASEDFVEFFAGPNSVAVRVSDPLFAQKVEAELKKRSLVLKK